MMPEEWDNDIASMKLSDVEKNGLQVYRNYQRAFATQAEKTFAAEVDADTASLDLTALERVMNHLAIEDARFLPVIMCTFVDDLLKAMFKSELPDGIPGGKSDMFGPYGPLSNLFNRLQLAFAFDMLSQDLVRDLDRVRKARNDLSHTWDIEAHKEFFAGGSVSEIFPVDELLVEDGYLNNSVLQNDDPLKKFRMRLTWMIARLAYEVPWYSLAKKRRLDANNALYGPNKPKKLSEIAGMAMASCKRISD